MEESRQNLVLRSEEFDDVAWTKTNSTVTADGAISPDGTMDADKIVSNSASLGYVVQSVSQTTGTSYTWSVFAKAGEYSFCQLRITGTVVPSITRAYFNLATGTTTGTTNCTASITAFGNGWYKCSITYTTISTTTALPRFYGQVDAADTVGDGTSGIYIWGAQMEAGSFPTSYIPTTTADATRAADVASISGSNFSSWYRQDEGTVFSDFTTTNTAGTNRYVWDIQQAGTTSNRVDLNINTSNVLNPRTVVSGGALISLTGGNYVNGAPARLAFGFKVSDYGSSFNGATSVTASTAGALPASLAEMYIGSLAANALINGTIRRLTYWPARLPDDTLQTITV